MPTINELLSIIDISNIKILKRNSLYCTITNLKLLHGDEQCKVLKIKTYTQKLTKEEITYAIYTDSLTAVDFSLEFFLPEGALLTCIELDFIIE